MRASLRRPRREKHRAVQLVSSATPCDNRRHSVLWCGMRYLLYAAFAQAQPVIEAILLVVRSSEPGQINAKASVAGGAQRELESERWPIAFFEGGTWLEEYNLHYLYCHTSDMCDAHYNLGQESLEKTRT